MARMNSRADSAGAAADGAQRIAERRSELASAWPDGWDAMLRAWAEPGPDACWLMYSANYLFRTGSVRWAVDPLTLCHKVPEADPVDVSSLGRLAFVLMTHNHSDHVDPALLGELSQMDVRWVVPWHMRKIAEAAGVDRRRMIEVAPGRMETIEIEGVRITPFQGMHLEYADNRWGVGEPRAGIESTGYYVEAGDRRLLLPGDTRTYDGSALPAFESVETVFAHVWLGRGAAMYDEPPLIEVFCDFVQAMRPRRRVVLAHLWQVARGPGDYWNADHAEALIAPLSNRLPNVEIRVPRFWEQVTLDQ